MSRTDVADIRDRAESALDAARGRAKDLAEDAERFAVITTRKARKRADKAAKNAGKSGRKASKKASKKVRQAAQDLSTTVQEKAGRKPRRGRKAAVLGGIALVGVGIAQLLGKRKAAAQSSPSYPAQPAPRPAASSSNGSSSSSTGSTPPSAPPKPSPKPSSAESSGDGAGKK